MGCLPGTLFDLADNALDNGYRTATYNWNGTLPMSTPADLRACLASLGCSLQAAPNLTQTRIDPNLKLPRTHEYIVGIDQQLFADWALRFNFVRKIQRGNYGTIAQQYSVTDYIPFQFRDTGEDGRPGTADDDMLTLYNRAVGTRPSDPLLTYLDGAGDMARTFELEGVKRMSNRWQFVAGADWTKRDLAASLFTTDPNTLIFLNSRSGNHYWDWTGKLIGTYEFPLGIALNTSFRSQKGEATGRTIAVNCTAIINAGQTCAQAGGSSLGQGNISRPNHRAGWRRVQFLPRADPLGCWPQEVISPLGNSGQTRCQLRSVQHTQCEYGACMANVLEFVEDARRRRAGSKFPHTDGHSQCADLPPWHALGFLRRRTMNTHRFWYRVASLVLVRLLLGETLLYAESPADHIRKEAFLRGGDAIKAALTTKVQPEVIVATTFTEKIPTPLPRTAARPQVPADKGMSKWLWTGLIAAFAASGALVYHFAAGPGASVRNCGTCK